MMVALVVFRTRDTFGEGDEIEVTTGIWWQQHTMTTGTMDLYKGTMDACTLMYQVNFLHQKASKRSYTFKWPNMPDEQQIPKGQILRTGGHGKFVHGMMGKCRGV